MSVPPADPADVAEQQLSAAPEATPAETAPDALTAEATEADLVEQVQDASAGGGPVGADLPLDADPADVAEQQAAVPLEDDDRRG